MFYKAATWVFYVIENQTKWNESTSSFNIFTIDHN